MCERPGEGRGGGGHHTSVFLQPGGAVTIIIIFMIKLEMSGSWINAGGADGGIEGAV